MHILIVEDDIRISNNIKKIFESTGYRTTVASNFEEAIYFAESETYDVIILDWMLPDKDGIEVCRKLREEQNTTPILMLTAKTQIEDRVEGLSIGADDYLTKPFAMEELLARVKALIRRKSGVSQSPLIEINDLQINTNTCQVKIRGREIALAPKEYALLEYLALNKGKVVDRLTLLHHVWGEEIDLFSNTVDVHIRYLRKKIGVETSKEFIKTIKGKGYLLCEN